MDVFGPRGMMLQASHEIRTLIDDVNAVFAGRPHQKYRIFSAHDSDISWWLRTFWPNFWFHGVPYVTTIFFKIFKKNGEYFVKSFYKNKPLQFTGCKLYYCTAQEFLDHMLGSTIQGPDLKVECDKTYVPPTQEAIPTLLL